MKFTGLDPISDAIEGGNYSEIEIYREKDNGYWDLHNACEFLGYQYNQEKQNAFLYWNYYYDYENSKFRKIALEFKKIFKFHVSDKDPEMPRYEDECLEDMHMIELNTIRLFFRGGQTFTISCEETVFYDPLPADKKI